MAIRCIHGRDTPGATNPLNVQRNGLACNESAQVPIHSAFGEGRSEHGPERVLGWLHQRGLARAAPRSDRRLQPQPAHHGLDPRL